MNTFATQSLPTAARQAQAALDRAHRAELRMALLRQPYKPVGDGLEREAELPTPFGAAAAAFIKARDQLNGILRSECEVAQAAAKEATRDFLAALFNQPLDRPITLTNGRGQQISERVVGLVSAHVGADGVEGFVRTTNQSGRSFDTRRFFERDGRVHFADHDIL